MTGSTKRTERDHKIVRVAARLFARQGYRGTSTREIARLAGISENTLFRHFESKENLFWTALRSGLAEWKLHKDLLQDIQTNSGPEVVLPRLLAQVVDTTILNPELLRLIAIAFLERRREAIGVCGEYLSPILDAVNRYLVVNIEEGRLRTLNPPLITAALVTMVLIHPVLSEFIDGALPTLTDSRQTIQTFSKFWIDVLAAPKEFRSQLGRQVIL